MVLVNAGLIRFGKIQNAVNSINQKLTRKVIQLVVFLVLVSGYNQKCSSNEECDKSKNLVCGSNGVCQCRDASLNWDDKSSSCSNLSIYQNIFLLKSF